MKGAVNAQAGSGKAVTEAALHATVHGMVQGVGFRYSARAEAAELGLSGWVRNLDSGDVEVWAEGPKEALCRFLAWLGKGPRWASVTGVDAAWPPATGAYRRFATEY